MVIVHVLELCLRLLTCQWHSYSVNIDITLYSLSSS